MPEQLTHDSFIEANGQRYFVRDSRDGDVAVLLVHGMPDDGGLWRHQIPALIAAGYRVIAADNLGCGQSARPEDPARYKKPMIVADLAAILNELGIAAVHYVGHDVGAGMGWQFTMAFPQRVLSFVTMTIGHPLSLAETSFTEEGARANWYLMANQLPNWGALWRAGDGRLSRMALGSHPDLETLLPKLMQPGELESLMMIDRTTPITDFLIAYGNGQVPTLPPITTPVLGIGGLKDPFMLPAQLEGSAPYLKGQWRCEMLDVGHWVPLEAPTRTNELLLEWFSATPQS